MGYERRDDSVNSVDDDTLKPYEATVSDIQSDIGWQIENRSDQLTRVWNVVGRSSSSYAANCSFVAERLNQPATLVEMINKRRDRSGVVQKAHSRSEPRRDIEATVIKQHAEKLHAMS